MSIISERKHLPLCSSVILLLLLQHVALTSGLQQSPTSVFVRRPISCRHESSTTCLWSTSLAEEVDHETQQGYDWDEQFKELQSFLSEYGHCNFPKNPSTELLQRYPTLSRFCQEQRIEYKKLQINSRERKKAMSLFAFDRTVRCRRLEELGFEFSRHLAKWFDHYHDLIQYLNDNGHLRVTRQQNPVLLEWTYAQRSRRNVGGPKSSCAALLESQIKLLDDIGFEWKSEIYDERWNTKYQELVAFHNEHGHFVTEVNSELYEWIRYQRKRRDGKKGIPALTDEHKKLLDEIDFPWKPEWYDAAWHANYKELGRFQKKYGRWPSRSTNLKLLSWKHYQQKKYRQGLLSKEKIDLLGKIGCPLERTSYEWPRMYRELVEFRRTHDHLKVNHDDNTELYDWMTLQREQYHGLAKPAMKDWSIEKLEDIHFCWSLDWRDRTWHEKYTEAAEFFKEHGHVRVAEEDNPSLYNWIDKQTKRFKELKGQKPLSEEELEMLEQIDFPFLEGQPRMAWNAMYAELESYREEHDGRFPTSHKDDPDLNRWVRQQRHRYRCAFGYAPLSDEQKSLLESIDFPMYPTGYKGRSWYEKYDELVDFRNERGNFLVNRSENPTLYAWIDGQRTRYNLSGPFPAPSAMEIYLLERIGFPWTSNRNEIEWQQNYEEVVEFWEAHGRLPKNSDHKPPDNKPLGRWVARQRLRYRDKRTTYAELSETQIKLLEKIGALDSISEE